MASGIKVREVSELINVIKSWRVFVYGKMNCDVAERSADEHDAWVVVKKI